MKPCISCGDQKPLDEYYKHPQMADGHLNKCKDCVKAYQRDRPYNKEYEQSRAMLPHRVKARADYQKTARGKEAVKRARENYTKKYPVKRKAVNMVNNAIRDGKLFKEPCEVCGSEDRVHAHHDDYAKPLNIRWLCPKHHREWHKENGPGANG